MNRVKHDAINRAQSEITFDLVKTLFCSSFVILPYLQERITTEHGTMAHHSHLTNGSFGCYESKYKS